jgi:hypothetical protein
MPGSVQNAAPSTVLPWSLSIAFVRSQEYPVLENEYAGGESQRSVLASNSRKRWRLSKRLAPAELVTLRNFYEARKGPQEPFYFYDPWDTSPKFSYDPTGQAVPGRYVVRFDGAWAQEAGLVGIDTSIELVEVA